MELLRPLIDFYEHKNYIAKKDCGCQNPPDNV